MVEALFSLIAALSVDARVAREAGRLKQEYGPTNGIEIPDAIIVATAERENLLLITLDRKHLGSLKGSIRVSIPF